LWDRGCGAQEGIGLGLVGIGNGIGSGKGIESEPYSLHLMMHDDGGGGMMHWNQGNHRPDSMHSHHGLVDDGCDDLDGCRMMNNMAENERGELFGGDNQIGHEWPYECTEWAP